MNDRFSNLIVLLNANISKKVKEKDGLTERKNDLSSSISELSNKVKDKENELSSLEEDLKVYNQYPLHICLTVAHIITSIVIELVLLATYLGYNYGIVINMFNSLFSLFLGGFVLCLTTALVFATSKLFYHVCKNDIKKAKKGKKIRKKHKSRNAIKRKISKTNKKIEHLISQLNLSKDEVAKINEMLDTISQDIADLQDKLKRTGDAFIQATLEIKDKTIERKLNEKYDESGLDEKILPASSDTQVKKLTYPDQGSN